MVQEGLLSCKNLEIQERSSRCRTVDSETMPHTVETKSERFSELDISQSSMAGHLRNLSKSNQNCWIVPHVRKILQNF